MRLRTLGALAAIAVAGLVGIALGFRGGAPRGPSVAQEAPAASDGQTREVAEAPSVVAEPHPPVPLPPDAEPATPERSPTRRFARGARARLRVEVLDAWDQPVPHVEIVATRIGEVEADQISEALYSGACDLDLPVGIPYRLEFVPEAPWFEKATLEPVRAEEGRVRCRLATNAVRVTGVVHGAEGGEAEPYALVSASVEGVKVQKAWCSDGAFDLRIPAGVVRLEAWVPGAAGDRYVSGKTGEWIERVDIFLEVVRRGVPPSFALEPGTPIPLNPRSR